MSDTIYLRNLHLSAAVGPDRWHRSGKRQPAILSLRLKYSVLDAAAKDDVAKTLNYGTLCGKVIEFVDANSGKWALRECAYELGRMVGTWAYDVPGEEPKGEVQVEILLPKGALRVEGGLGIELSMKGYEVTAQVFIVKELRVPCIIGVNAHERVEKQIVVINLRMSGVRRSDLQLNGQPMVKAVAEHVEGSAFETLEALVTFVARIICMNFRVELVTVSVEKPSALPFVDGAGVEITRDRDFFRQNDVWQVNST